MTATPASSARRPLAFFTLIFPLSIPFWILGQAAPRDLVLAATIVTIVWKPKPLEG